MDRETLAKSWLSRSRDTLEPLGKVDLAILGNVKRQPRKLSRGEVDALIRRQKVGFGILVIR